jgi:hypothetical protein
MQEIQAPIHRQFGVSHRQKANEATAISILPISFRSTVDWLHKRLPQRPLYQDK